MQNMFTNYENLSSVYVPNNRNIELENNTTLNLNLPRKEYDITGKFIGYSWSYGETLVIPYSVDKVIYVEEDALVFDAAGASPSTSTVGTFGQKAYNTADRKSWVCRTLDNAEYAWEEQAEFTYPLNGNKKIVLVSSQDIDNVSIEFSISNFRREKVYSVIYPSARDVSLVIDSELSNKLIDGIYYCTVTILRASDKRVDSEFVLLVKDRESFYESNTLNIMEKQEGAVNAWHKQ